MLLVAFGHPKLIIFSGKSLASANCLDGLIWIAKSFDKNLLPLCG